MGLLQKATNQTAFLKAGVHGFQGSGKTFTAKELAVGISKRIGNNKPVAMLDTETGSDFLIPTFNQEGIELLVLKSRAFKDLLTVIDEAEKECSVLIVDSITHVWQDLMRSFERSRNRRNGLLFQDWSVVKTEWAKFTTKYINSQLHIIMCGRAGYEYDMSEDESGKKELIKTGNKMKAETETGYEPNLGLYMERIKKSTITGNPNEAGIINRCHVIKDRSDRMNGAVIDFPKYKDFLPHIEFLNIGGKHIGIDETRNSEDIFEDPDMSAAQYRRQVEITLDLIKEEFIAHDLGGTANDVKKKKGSLLEAVFETRSWKAVEEMRLEKLQACLELLRQQLRGGIPITDEPPNDMDLPGGVVEIDPPKSD
jgi:hypothetical protein